MTGADAVSRRDVLAAILLASGTCVGLFTTLWLGKQPGVPERWAVPAMLFLAAFLLAVIAGSLRAGETLPPSASAVPAMRVGSPIARVAAGAVALGCFAQTWVLQNREVPPLSALATWAVAMVATVLAFPGVLRLRPRAGTVSRDHVFALAGIFLIAAGARLVGLDRVYPVFSGDEATVAMDGQELLNRRGASDPFGTGANSSMRLGMLPGGVGAALFDSKVAGARRLYALIGTLALAATAATAWLLGGPWAALGGLALIAFAPIHVHFSRSSNNVVVDSLLVTAGVFFLLAVLRTGSPRLACLAGVFSGLSLYGYGGGRVMPVVLLASLPVLLWRFRAAPRGRRALLVLAVVAGFGIAAGPTLHYASTHFEKWNGRFNQTSIFEPGWHRAEVARLGSEANLYLNQIRLGTIGLLSSPPLIDIYTGFPQIAPAVLPALGIVGLGWLYGRRRIAEATIAGLVVAGNLAGVSFTVSTPQAHRASSLVPMLAVLGGIAVAGFLAAFPERARGVPWRAAIGSLLIGGFLARQVSGFPLDWSEYKGAGGGHAALAQSVCLFVGSPRYQHELVYFHGGSFVYWDFPSFRYFLPDRSVIDVVENNPKSFPPGLHVFSEEFLRRGAEWASALGLRGIPLPHPADPFRNVAFAFLVPPGETRTLPAAALRGSR
jgi:hypothetical protein